MESAGARKRGTNKPRQAKSASTKPLFVLLAALHGGEQSLLVADPGVFVPDDGLRREGGRGGLQAGESLDGGADGHELDQAAQFVNVSLDADDVLGADG